MFKTHQLEAIDISIKNNFDSGVHFHATGTGKSWIALQIAIEFAERNPLCNIMWICEQKSILQEQFSKIKIKTKDNKSFLLEKLYSTFLIYNFSENKNKDSKWFNTISNSIFWKKPSLIVINRAFLTSGNKYELMKVPIHLIIHDECHTVKNKTTQAFYSWIIERYPTIKCIGFSATPYLEIEPYKKLLSKFSIYQGYSNDVILPPRIIWYKSETILNISEIADLVKQKISDLPYKKILVWCGIIEDCYRISKEWQKLFPEFKIFIDTSSTTSVSNDVLSLEEFYKLNENGFLFCACKHREGSDIPNLDGCIFLDKVEDRGSKTFIQCIGRVLRKDALNKKQYGLILDLKASCCMDIIHRIHPFLFLDDRVFPWKHKSYPSKAIKKTIIIHELNMLKNTELTNIDNSSHSNEKATDYSIDEVKGLFVRSIELKDLRYHQRLEMELELLEKKKLFQYLVRALDILELTKGIPHVTRGSCGSSLVCYLLGISHVDPVKYNITFARFLNEYRDNLPDIDFDFPYNIRKDVFLKLEEKYPGKMARISNHIYYQEKSSLREAVRTVGGIKTQIPKLKLIKTINTMSPELKQKVYKKQNELKNTFRTYSLHCGGIIYYPNGVPEEKVLYKSKDSVLKQVILNKEDVSKEKHFKIDILSSRSLAIIQTILGSEISFDELRLKNDSKIGNFEDPILDPNVFEMLSNGDNIGITLAESPLMRKTLITIRPKSIEDLALCLAIIRPAAKKAKNASYTSIKDIGDYFVFDDDAIIQIASILDCSEAEADKIRRIFAKNDQKGMKEFYKILEKKDIPESNKQFIIDSLLDLSQYSFCKAHAFSYAQLIYQLAYLKYHKPIEFWKAVLQHSHSSYKHWVHRYEARLNGLDSNYLNERSKEISIYAQNRRKKIDTIENPHIQMKTFGYWRMLSTEFFPDCHLERIGKNTYNIRGLIASSKVFLEDNSDESSSKIEKQNTIVLFLGVKPKVYVEVIIENIQFIPESSIGCSFENAILQKAFNAFFASFTTDNYKFF